MKSKYLFILMISLFFKVYANDYVVIAPMNKIIPIYDSPISLIANNSVCQDSINEFYYVTKVIEETPLRFKIELLGELDGNTKCDTKTLIGWIDKQNCGVYLRCYYDNKKNSYIKLYKQPTRDSSFQMIYTNDMIWVPVLSISKEWKQILYYHKGVLYIGWIELYCSNIYNSCN